MKIMDTLALSTRMFKARAMRTFLTVLGMGVGIGAILFLVSLGYGLQNALLARITTSESLVTLDVFPADSAVVKLDQTMIDAIGSIEGVDRVSSSFRLMAQGSIEGTLLDLSAIGTTPDFMFLGGTRLTKGEDLTDQRPNGILISSTLAEVLEREKGDIFGKTIDLSFFLSTTNAESDGVQEKSEKLDVSGEYSILGVIPSEESIIYVNTASFSHIPVMEFSQLKVRCHSSDVIPAIREAILQKGLLVSSLSDTVDQANKIFKIVQFVLMGFGIVALIVSAIGMFNTMTITLMERTEEIGIMKSIGASDFDISLLFILESMVMGFLGGMGGAFLGITGGMVINVLINILATHLGGKSVSLFYSPTWFVVLIILFATCVGLLTALVPARRASKIDPLEALRYK